MSDETEYENLVERIEGLENDIDELTSRLDKLEGDDETEEDADDDEEESEQTVSRDFPEILPRFRGVLAELLLVFRLNIV